MRFTMRKLAPTALVAVLIASAGFAVQPDRPRPQQPGQREGQPGRPGGPAGPGGGERPIQSVGGGMRALNRGMRTLESTIGDPAKKEESLQAVWMMQRGCLGAKAAKPEDIEGDPEQMLIAYRHGQIRLMAMLLELETAILDGKTDVAKAVLAKTKEHRDASHKALGVKDEDEGGGEGGGGGGR